MKLTIIGGGGVRTPRLIPSLVKRAERLGLSQLWLMDNDPRKLDLIGGLCRALADDASFEMHLTTDAREAVRGAQHVITAIRPGLEDGRARDERICFDHGVLGQETTGAAGFAMAMRSVPAILGYARLIEEVGAPGAWLYNFTNPAGLVAQALHDAGVRRVVGICDSANGAQHAVSRFLNVPLRRVHHRVYGLNHLSWSPSVRLDPEPDGTGGEEVFPGLLFDERFVAATHMSMFAPGLREWQAAFLNEYLHYYFHRDEALAALIGKAETRGEETMRLTAALLDRLRFVRGDTDASLKVYQEVMGQRSRTYMAHARGGADRVKMEPVGEDEEGYAAVALGCVEAIQNGALHYTGLNVPNAGAIEGMAEDDIVEVGCWIDADGIRPQPVGAIRPDHLLLMQNVKQYERLAAGAILTRDRSKAVQALAVHPLIGSYPLAEKLVAAFLEAHAALIGEWQ
ncbi:MAG: 6-phospho-beta-glucosidase [Anaerolineae bacterium]|nr:6-phospho-beta-glucosidase [Anaerolineae bacterium]NUQ05157.1 6-phospho-beta-glucosidase [Anaerolineae bacterium]